MLRPRKKITKRDIKEDALVTAYFHVQKFFQKYSKHTNIIIGIAIVIGILSIIIIQSKRKAELSAAGQIGIAEQYYYATNYEMAKEELAKVINTYSGTKSAGRAVFLLANSYYETEDYSNAQKYYEIYVDDYSSNKFFLASSFAGIANCLDNQEEFKKAANLYERAGRVSAKSYKAPYYYRDAGRCYVLANDIEKGKEMYLTVLEKYPDSNIKPDIEFLLESL
jgi:tetratricopeptide (TPR) repeat protein